VAAGDAFCENCGAVLGGPAAPPPSRVEKQGIQPVQPSPSNEPFRLVIKAGPNPGQTFDLFKEVMSIGRESNNDITIKDTEISRNHARISRKGGAYLLEDLGSTNGTFVNQERLTAPYTLATGDEIGVGTNVVATFEGPSAAAPSGGSGKLVLGCVVIAVVLCIVTSVGAFLFYYLFLR
jgi:pSer/pThr/pTyr-binding forkhead associated (FHA) protein